MADVSTPATPGTRWPSSCQDPTYTPDRQSWSSCSVMTSLTGPPPHVPVQLPRKSGRLAVDLGGGNAMGPGPAQPASTSPSPSRARQLGTIPAHDRQAPVSRRPHLVPFLILSS